MHTEAGRSLRTVSTGLSAVSGPEAPEASTAAMGKFSELRRWLLGVSMGLPGASRVRVPVGVESLASPNLRGSGETSCL